MSFYGAACRNVLVPQLTRDEHVVARDCAFRNLFLQRAAHFVLVRIDPGFVYGAIAGIYRELGRLIHLTGLFKAGFGAKKVKGSSCERGGG